MPVRFALLCAFSVESSFGDTMAAPNNGDNDRELANVTPQADIEQDNVQHEERDVEKNAADVNGSKSPAERNETEIVSTPSGGQ